MYKLLLAFIIAVSLPLSEIAYSKGGGASRASSGSRSFSSSKSSFGSSSSSKPSSSSSSSWGSSSSSSKPSSSSSSKSFFGSSSSSSSKPTTSSTNISSKALANKQTASSVTYAKSKQATAPPKSSYVAPNGKTVTVRTNSSQVATIRSKPSTSITPAARETATVTHINNYHYSQPYSYYQSQPFFDVGGGYSSIFWYMMMDWSAQRRAEWFYHNQSNIEKEAYEKGMKDAEVARLVAEMKTKNTPVNQDYVDSEFKNDPQLMYTQNYVEAAYNPKVESKTSWWWYIAIPVSLIFVFAGFVLYWRS